MKGLSCMVSGGSHQKKRARSQSSSSVSSADLSYDSVHSGSSSSLSSVCSDSISMPESGAQSATSESSSMAPCGGAATSADPTLLAPAPNTELLAVLSKRLGDAIESPAESTELLNPITIVHQCFFHGKAQSSAKPRTREMFHALEEALARFQQNKGYAFHQEHRSTRGLSCSVNIIAVMLGEAAMYHRYFPDGVELLVESNHNEQQTATFTKQQCFCILANAFFCTFPGSMADVRNVKIVDRTTGVQHKVTLPSMNFDEMHAARYSSKRNSVEVAKLLMFMDYFEEMAERIAAAETPEGKKPPWSCKVAALQDTNLHSINIMRRKEMTRESNGREDEQASVLQLLPLHKSKELLRRPVLHANGESIDDQKTMIRADFANQIIGGAAISFGCVQEEITFSICPELCVSRLICTPMSEPESIVFAGVEQFSVVKPGTYAFSLEYGGPYCPSPEGDDPATSFITAIDAIDLRGASRRMQYHPQLVFRDIFKAYAGFNVHDTLTVERVALQSNRNDDEEETRNTGEEEEISPEAEPNMPLGCWSRVGKQVPTAVATGNWGCGAFLGDVEIKILTQWVACAYADKQMHYFPFSEGKVAPFAEYSKRLVEKRVSIGQMVAFLLEHLDPKLGVFAQLVDHFGLCDKKEEA